MTDRTSIVVTIRTSLGNTLNFVSYHLNIGIDHIYLFFDNPDDPAINFLSKNKKVTCFKCNLNHWSKLTNKKKLSIEERQKLNADMAFKKAKKESYNWIAHIDSDELIYTRGSLKILLSKVPKEIQVLRLRTMEAVPEKCEDKNLFREITLFKNLGQISKIYYSHKKILQKIVPLLKKCEGNISGIYFRAHAVGKSIIRTNSNINRVEIHEPSPKEGCKLKCMFVSNASLLHFDSCSFEDWKLKWIRRLDGTATAKGLCNVEARLLEDFAKAYEIKDINKIYKLYRKQYFMSWIKKFIFKRVGLLKQINLNEKLFRLSENFKEE